MQISPLRWVVGLAAIVAPALHSVSDVMEWYQHGFSAPQLWINYIAFLPMPWLLLGIYAVHQPNPRPFALIGALLYGAAFSYFTFTTLYALAEGFGTYEALWDRLGDVYTFHGGMMVLGGMMFAVGALHGRWLPRAPLFLFIAGLLVNLVVALVPAPDIYQTVGSALRNLGLMGMGIAVLRL